MLIVDGMVKIGDIHLLEWFHQNFDEEIDYHKLIDYYSQIAILPQILKWFVDKVKVPERSRALFQSAESGCLENFKILIEAGYPSCCQDIFIELVEVTDDVDFLEFVYYNLNRTTWARSEYHCSYHGDDQVSTELVSSIVHGNLNSARWIVDHCADFHIPYTRKTHVLEINEHGGDDFEVINAYINEIGYHNNRSRKSERKLDTSALAQLRELFSETQFYDLKYTFISKIEGSERLSKEISNIVYTLIFLYMDLIDRDPRVSQQIYELCKFMLSQEEFSKRVKWYYNRTNLKFWDDILDSLIFHNLSQELINWMINGFFMDKNAGSSMILRTDNLDLFKIFYDKVVFWEQELEVDIRWSPKIFEYCIEREVFRRTLIEIFTYHCNVHSITTKEIEFMIDIFKRYNKFDRLTRNPIVLQETKEKNIQKTLIKHGLKVVVKEGLGKTFRFHGPILCAPQIFKPFWLS